LGPDIQGGFSMSTGPAAVGFLVDVPVGECRLGLGFAA